MHFLSIILLWLAYLTGATDRVGISGQTAAPQTVVPSRIEIHCQMPASGPNHKPDLMIGIARVLRQTLGEPLPYDDSSAIYTQRYHRPMMAFMSAVILNTGSEYPSGDKQTRRIVSSPANTPRPDACSCRTAASHENHLHGQAFERQSKYYFLFYLHRLRI